MIKVFSFEQMKEAIPYINEKVFDYIYDCCTESFESFESCNLLVFDFYDIHSESTDTSKLMLYQDQNSLLIFAEDDALVKKAESILNKIPTFEYEASARTMYKFFEKLLHGDLGYLQKFEQTLNDAEDVITENPAAFDAKQFSKWRKELLRLKRYYMQLDTIFDEMEDNDNNLLSSGLVHRISALSRRSERYFNAVENLKDALEQIRGIYQSELSIKQNELMQIFTLVTVIFLPLTLIAGWYGMNFTNMPELHWKYGYIGVISFSGAIVIIMIWIFKKKKWF